ncbi:unnamed protein product, partial [Prorocentrum cordatum]
LAEDADPFELLVYPNRSADRLREAPRRCNLPLGLRPGWEGPPSPSLKKWQAKQQSLLDFLSKETGWCVTTAWIPAPDKVQSTGHDLVCIADKEVLNALGKDLQRPESPRSMMTQSTAATIPESALGALEGSARRLVPLAPSPFKRGTVVICAVNGEALDLDGPVPRGVVQTRACVVM